MIRYWHCPACGANDVTNREDVHTQFHTCPAAGGMTVPFAPADVKAKLVVIERDDYVGSEQVQLNDEGRPIMAAKVVYDGGEHLAVYAPCATGDVETGEI